MHIANLKAVMGFANQEEGRLADGLHYFFKMQRDSVQELLQHRDAQPTREQLASATEFLDEITSLTWTANQLTDLLCLYPRARIKLAAGLDAEEELAFSAAHFFLSTAWNTYGDNIESDAFVNLIQKQALLMGFAKRSCDIPDAKD